MDNTITNERQREDYLWKGVYLLWVLRLFRPDWLVSSYIYALSPLRKLPTIALIVIGLVWLTSDARKYNFKLLSFFLIAFFFSSLLSENTGRARIALREIFEIYILACITISYIDDEYKMDKLFKLLVFYFSYYAIWGIIGNGRVLWDNILNEEDAYGPLMCIGLAYCFQYYLSQYKGITKKIALISSVLCLGGVIVSFARGAFLSLIATILFLWLRGEKKIKGLCVVGLSIVAIFIGASIFFQEKAFWKEMETISEGTSKGTGHDRKILWTVAWLEFKDYPIMGVGPFNFGVHAPKYVAKLTDRTSYLDPGQIWGRVTHNAYFQILCEQGLVGLLIFIIIIIDFIRKNSQNKKYCRFSSYNKGSLTHKRHYYISVGLEISMVAFLTNAFFYDIIYYPWFWNLVILNRLMFVVFPEQNIEYEKKIKLE